MSIKVSIDDLVGVIGERGEAAYLVTVREGRPHVVAVAVRPVEGRLVVAAGRRSAANLADHPDVTLMWPTNEAHRDHTLLVDGTAAVSEDGEWVFITPTAAILHRAGGRRRRLPDE